jgi:hypothetical protein
MKTFCNTNVAPIDIISIEAYEIFNGLNATTREPCLSFSRGRASIAIVNGAFQIQISSNPNLNNLILISWNSIPTQLLNLSNPLSLSLWSLDMQPLLPMKILFKGIRNREGRILILIAIQHPIPLLGGQTPKG